MATFTIEIKQSGQANYVFAYTPYFTPKHKPIYNNTEPPVVIGVEETWEIEDAILLDADPGDLNTKYNTLKNLIQNRANPIIGVQFKKDGTVTQEIDTTSHTQFRVERADFERGEGAWNNWLKMTLTVKGVKGLPGTSTTTENNEEDVTELELNTEYSYSPEGFLTKRQFGSLKTKGANAEARARTFKLLLPSSKYTYVTNGPEGVNVTVTDKSGNSATFDSTIREQALAFPNNSTYEYSLIDRETQTKYSTYITRTITAQASTLDGAKSAAEVGAPSDSFILDRSTDIDETVNRVVNIYTFRSNKTGNNIVSYSHRVQRIGGFTGIKAIEVPGAAPALVRTPANEITITETLEVGASGSPANCKIPPPLFPANHDAKAYQESWGKAKVAANKPTDSTNDEYVRVVTRVYKFGKADPSDRAIEAAIQALSSRLTESDATKGAKRI